MRRRLPPRAGAALALLLPLSALSVLAQGFQLPGNGNSYHWPILFGWVGSAAGPGDLFTDSLAHYVSHFWTPLAWVTTEESVGWLFWLLHIALRLLQVAALALLIRRLGGSTLPRAVLLAGLATMALQWFPLSPLGHGEVLLDTVSNATATTALALVFLWLAVEGRWRAAAFVVGLGINVSAFAFAWCGLLLLAAWAADRERNWRALPWMAALVLLPALPTVWWIAETVEATRPQLPAFDFRDFLREFYPGHVIAGASGAERALAPLFLLVAWCLLPQFQVRHERRLHALLVALAGILLFGSLLPHLTGSRLLLNLLPLRMDFLLVWLALAMALAAVASRSRTPLHRGDVAVLATLASGAWLALAALLAEPGDWRRASFRKGILLLLPLAFWALPGMAQTFESRLEGALLLGGTLLLLSFLDAQTHGGVRLAALGLLAALHYGQATSQLAWAPPLAAGALLLYWLPSWLPWRRRHLAWPALALLLAAGLLLQGGEARGALLLLAGALVPLAGQRLLSYSPVNRLAWRTPLALLLVVALLPMAVHLAQGGRLDRYDERAAAFLEVQRWARQATPPHSLFLQPDEQLVPNGTPSFWTLSRRPAWIDWRMGAAAHWLPDYYWLWHERMAEVRALENVAAKLAYARERGIAYLVLSAEEPLPAGAPAPLYDDGYWRVLPAE